MYQINKIKKSLGQNFLIDNNVINKIIKIGNISKSQKILEIGPGLGALTNKILEMNPAIIFAVEKDKNLIEGLNGKFKNFSKIKIINNDIINLLENNHFGNNITVFGNLPYNISTKIISTLILLKKWPPWYKNLIFMFQKEVADRIIAKDKD